MTKEETPESIAKAGTSFLGRFLFATHKAVELKVKRMQWHSWKDGFTKGYAKGFAAAEKMHKEQLSSGGMYEIMKKATQKQ